MSDGSGFITAATTTATEIGYVNGVTSAIQTQLDAKIAASVLTTNGDMLYRAAGVPARLGIGTSGYYLLSNGSSPVWTNPNISTSYITRAPTIPTALSIGTTFAALPLSDTPTSQTNLGTGVTRNSNRFTFPFAGNSYYEITLYLGSVQGTSGRNVEAILYNATTASTVQRSVANTCIGSNGVGMVFFLISGAVTSTSDEYEIQLSASGSGVTINNQTVDSLLSRLWWMRIHRPPQ